MLKELFELGHAIDKNEKRKPFGEAIISASSWFFIAIMLTYITRYVSEDSIGFASFLMPQFFAVLLYITFSIGFITRLIYIFKHQR
ncbi:hypothetical protein [Scandinavium goeteborgense]|uniref:Uncharacterized protein n=1 Tax=Scandinavium goeteborgense TaxID=1851514 RepID=A0A4V3BLT8_SCAGO|nr:hypothetical protein [Scandinavium goeteborgense]TDN48092.1 hypothetical protein EC847_12843 [Scandinavium goeteborgense]